MSEKASWIATYDEKDRCIKLAEYLIDHNSTVRATAKRFGISKSTVHKDIAEKLPHIQFELYQKAKDVLEKNKAERHLRGGQATKDKYRILLKAKHNMK
jgi:putative DeoR family transcriptional regulator (stage III sporulation protein D)